MVVPPERCLGNSPSIRWLWGELNTTEEEDYVSCPSERPLRECVNSSVMTLSLHFPESIVVDLICSRRSTCSIVAVTLADKYLDSKKRRFLGICIRREKQMLHHTFTLRNIINGLGVEIMYDLYSPDIQKIEVIRLERRLDNDLSYLVDALQQYSTFDMNMEALQSPLGKPVHINPIKVIMKPPPWGRRWELYNIKGIDEKSVWGQVLPFHKKKFIQYTKDTSYEYYDLIKHYREDGQEREHEMKVMAEMLNFEAEKEKLGVRAKRRILRANSKTHHHKWSIDEEI